MGHYVLRMPMLHLGFLELLQLAIHCTCTAWLSSSAMKGLSFSRYQLQLAVAC